MKPVLKQFAVVPCLAMVWLTAPSSAYAEPTRVDQNIIRIMQEDRTAGLIFMEAIIVEQGQAAPKLCQRISARLVSDTGEAKTVITQVSPTLFGQVSESSSYGGSTTLAAGTYTVQYVECESATGIRLQGPFARFTVRAGQILNLGCLTINYKLGPPTLFTRSENKGDWKAVDLSPKAVAWINKAAPMAFAKAKKQFMTPIREAPKS